MSDGLFGLSGDPFRINADSRFFFESKIHSEAYAQLLEGARKLRPLIVLSGEPGTGKTTVLEKLCADLRVLGFSVVSPQFAHLPFDGLLDQLCEAAGLSKNDRDHEPAEETFKAYLATRASGDRTTAIILDEAQLTPTETLSQLFTFLHQDTGYGGNTTVVLAGQTDLVEKIHSTQGLRELVAEDDRTTLTPLKIDEVEPFVRHRLDVCGHRGPDLFSREAIERIATVSGGVPRLVNHLCGMSLHFAKVEGEEVVSGATVETLCSDYLSNLGPFLRSPNAEPKESTTPDRMKVLPGSPASGDTVPEGLDPLEPEPYLMEGLTASSASPEGVSGEEAAADGIDRKPLVDSNPEEEFQPKVDPVPARIPARRQSGWVPAGVALGALGVFGAVFFGDLFMPTVTDVVPQPIDGSNATRAEQAQAQDSQKLVAARSDQSSSGETQNRKAQADGVADTPVTEREAPGTTNGSNGTSEAPGGAPTPPVLRLALSDHASLPTVQVSNASGVEDQAVPLLISATLNDPDKSNSLVVTVGGLPEGASLSAGKRDDGGVWRLQAGELGGLTLKPPPGFAGTAVLRITASAPDPQGDTVSASADLVVALSAVADTPLLEVTRAEGPEDHPLVLDIVAAPRDPDGSERLELAISGIPEGASLSAGSRNEQGTWHLTSADLPGLKLLPSSGFSGDTELGIKATALESDGSSAASFATLPLTLTAVASSPSLEVSDAAGFETDPVPLNISAALQDLDGSESLEIEITGLPEGATLSSGAPDQQGTWHLAPSDLAGLRLLPSKGQTGVSQLQVSAVAQERDGDTARTTKALTVTLAAVADPPTLRVADATGQEGERVALSIDAAVSDESGSETLAVALQGLPEGASLSSGSLGAEGTWRLTAADLDHLYLIPPEDFSGQTLVQVIATASEADGDTATTSADLSLSLSAVADRPILEVADAAGPEDEPLDLNIKAALSDLDGSESLEVVIAGLPDGATLSSGKREDDGSWHLSQEDLGGLRLIPPSNLSGEAILDVSAIAREAEGDVSVANEDLHVTLSPVADAPLLEVASAKGLEDKPVPLRIAAALKDTDGSEVLAVKIAGEPEGTSFSAGERDQNGTWHLTAQELGGLRLIPPEDFNGPATLRISAIASEADDSTATSTADLSLSLTGVADPPSLVVSEATGEEGSAVTLNIAATLKNSHASESLEVAIAGLPEGATLSSGSSGEGERWTLSPAELEGLQLLIPESFAGQATLQVTATSREADGDTAATTDELHLTVTEIAAPPLLEVSAAEGVEDSPVDLDLRASLRDDDGSEVLQVSVSGLPEGAALSAGEREASGAWSLAPTNLPGLRFLPPPAFSGTAELKVVATSQVRNGDTATTAADLRIRIRDVADPPLLAVADATGSEDEPLALKIIVAPRDRDGSERLELTVSGLPDGAALSAGALNELGEWHLEPKQLTDLRMLPPEGFSGETTLKIKAAAQELESGRTATTIADLPVTIAATADLPSLEVSGAMGEEDTPLPLAINASLGDRDGSESLEVLIDGLPEGASLTSGRQLPDGTWRLEQEDLDTLSLITPDGFSGETSLRITAIAHEKNGSSATAKAELVATQKGVADSPSLQVADASGDEGNSIALTIDASLADQDGSESLELSIAGLPQSMALSAGQRRDDGTWRLSPPDLAELELNTQDGFSGQAILRVTATARETDGDTATTVEELLVTVNDIVAPPTLRVSDASGKEGDSLPLTISVEAADQGGTKAPEVVIADLPEGARLSAGARRDDGLWALAPSDLADLVLTAPETLSGTFHLRVRAIAQGTEGNSATATARLTVTLSGVADTPILRVEDATGKEGARVPLKIETALADQDGSESLAVAVAGLPEDASLSAGTRGEDGIWRLSATETATLQLLSPQNFSGRLPLTVTATAQEADGDTAASTDEIIVSLTGVADTPTLRVEDATGEEGARIPLRIEAALADRDGSESLAIAIAGLPEDASLSAGTRGEDGTWQLSATETATLELLPPQGFSGSIPLAVRATAQEADGDSATAATELSVALTGVADTPTLRVEDATGGEGASVPLEIEAALADRDGSESLAIAITGLPEGASLSAGAKGEDGTWRLSATDTATLELLPPQGFSGSIPLTVTATAQEADGDTAASTDKIIVALTGVADAPILRVEDATGGEGARVPLKIEAALADQDGSESLAVAIAGLPEGASLSAGARGDDGIWRLSATEMATLQLLPPQDFSGRLPLTVTATAQEADGDTAASTDEIIVSLTGVADTPTLRVEDATGGEGARIPLKIEAALTDQDGSESLAVAIAGLPEDASLSAGTRGEDGTWRLSATDTATLELLPPQGFSGSIPLTVTATAQEADGDTAASTDEIIVALTGVADAPILRVEDATGNEGQAVPLTISAALADRDGSETLDLAITGVPDDAALSSGKLGEDGTWWLGPTDLEGLTLRAPNDMSGEVRLLVTATARENDGASAATVAELGVTLLGIADPPLLRVENAKGLENGPVAIEIEADLRDKDGSESLELTVAGLPEDFELSSGQRGRDGLWHLSSSDLRGLKLLSPEGRSGQTKLEITAITREADGDSAVTTEELLVTLIGVANSPTLEVKEAAGEEGEAVPLDIKASLSDQDGSETLIVTISSLPEGASLSSGRRGKDGLWTLTAADLAGLQLLPPDGLSGPSSLLVRAIAEEADGDSAAVTSELKLTLTPAKPLPSPELQAAEAQQSDPQIAGLLAKGNEFLRLGDLASARLFFELAFEYGSAEAALLVGKTHDPNYLEEIGALGAGGNSAKAVEWYKQALEAGESRALAPLEALAPQ